MLSIFSSLGIAAVSGAMAISPRFRSYHSMQLIYSKQLSMQTSAHYVLLLCRFYVAWIGMDSTCTQYHGIHSQSICFYCSFSHYLPACLLSQQGQQRRIEFKYFRSICICQSLFLQCRLQPQVFTNSANTNYMSGETVNMSMPPPPPPGFHINAPLPQPQHNQQHHQQQRGYSSSPLPRLLVSSDTNIWTIVIEWVLKESSHLNTQVFTVP